MPCSNQCLNAFTTQKEGEERFFSVCLVQSFRVQCDEDQCDHHHLYWFD